VHGRIKPQRLLEDHARVFELREIGEAGRAAPKNPVELGV
jgi:hypothetical protein